MVRKLKVAVSGLGRMGARHAINYLERTPRAELVAACDPGSAALAWAKEHLEPHGVTIYSDFDSMLSHPGIEAVIISGITTEHAPQTMKAIRANKHVMCEKPLSTDVSISQRVVDLAAQHPHLKVMTGFSRRFDTSYRNAYTRLRANEIGRPVIIRSQTCDLYRDDDYFVNYSLTAGSIFLDASVHDIDLALWFFGGSSPAILKTITAVGTCAVYPALSQHGDVDNGIGIVEFWGGKLAYFYACRMMAAGQEDTTEIIGTEGKMTINAHPALDRVEMHDRFGVRRECDKTYWDRFRQAFVVESQEFTDACLDGGELPLKLEGAVEALRIGGLLQESLRSGRKLFFDEKGERIEEGKARL